MIWFGMVLCGMVWYSDAGTRRTLGKSPRRCGEEREREVGSHGGSADCANGENCENKQHCKYKVFLKPFKNSRANISQSLMIRIDQTNLNMQQLVLTLES